MDQELKSALEWAIEEGVDVQFLHDRVIVDPPPMSGRCACVPHNETPEDALAAFIRAIGVART